MPHAPSPATTYRANRFRLLPNREDERTLRLLGDRVSALWNTANYVCRQAFLAKHPVPGYTALCATLRPHETYAALPSDVAQEVVKKLAEAWRGYGQLRTRWSAGTLPNKPGLPRYRKHRDGTRPTDFIPIKSARSYAIDAHRFALTLPADLRHKSGSRLDRSHRGLKRYTGAPGRGELRFDAGRGRWYLHAAVRVPQPVARAWQRAAAIDLGIRVLVSLCVEDTPAATHYLGREVLKDWDYWGRQISEHMGELAHRPKGQRASRKLRRLYHQRRSRWTHAWEALATRVAADCRRHKIGGGLPRLAQAHPPRERLWRQVQRTHPRVLEFRPGQPDCRKAPHSVRYRDPPGRRTRHLEPVSELHLDPRAALPAPPADLPRVRDATPQ